MFWEKKLDRWISRMRPQLGIPLRLELWNGHQLDLGGSHPEVTIRVTKPSALTYLLQPSLESLGRAYVEGKLEVEGRLRAVIQTANQLAELGQRQRSRLGKLFRARAHSKAQDARAIAYHYDVSNTFYQAFLDREMVYSCAYFEQGDEDLATAQQKKIDHILNKIALRPGHRLLDIGCGWGALVIRAAQHYGAHCVGITLSAQQRAWATERIKMLGLENQVSIQLLDYRDVYGQYDRITSVGMFEHVGIKNLPLYFSKLSQLLTDDGLMMNHGICTTNTDHRTARYGAGEFIAKYVFPHGELPHAGTVLLAMQDGGLETLDVENLRRHYARTCTHWADNFERNDALIRSLVDDKTHRIWRIYLAGCAHAFENDWVSLYQVLCGKSGRPTNRLPWSRRYMYTT
ncbi:MAG: class I SAM-dependent methyltransferase [Betaproteobacteria bacterium]